MMRVIWTGSVLSGKYEEYKRRHDEIWPEMKEALSRAGVRNYAIWSDGSRLIGCYECENSRETENRKKAEPVVKRWAESMKGLMCMDEKQPSEIFFMD